MHQRKDDKDVQPGQTSGLGPRPEDEFVFPDWDNPEDRDDGAPEGYYDDQDEEEFEDDEDDDDSYIPDEDDPDYDLSEQAGYADWEPSASRGLMPQWVITTIAVILVLALVFPLFLVLR